MAKKTVSLMSVTVKTNQGQDIVCLYSNNNTRPICENNQLFQMITEVDENGSVVYATTVYDGWFGFGKEVVSDNSIGFLARAVYSGLIAKNLYSYEPTPTGANVVLGGYNQSHFNGNYTVITSDSQNMTWNTTLRSFNFAGSNLYQRSTSSKSISAYF